MIKKILLIFGLSFFLLFLFISFTVAGVIKTANIPSRNYNLLFLGLDPRDDIVEKTLTTDTIILASFNFSTRRLSLISFPRDLWSYSTNTKINQIYPDSFSSAVIPDWNRLKQEFIYIAGQKIDSVVVVTTQNLIDLVGILGGVSVDLPYGFIDKNYPNPEYIKNPQPSTPIYITVEFPSGQNWIDSSNVVPFVRSRKSSDNPLLGGTDLGRIARQQLLIENLLQQSLSPARLNPGKLQSLYRFWHTIQTDIDDRLLLALGLKFVLSSSLSTPINLSRLTIPVAEGKNVGLIYHPDKFITPAWVFIPKDGNYELIHQFVGQNLH